MTKIVLLALLLIATIVVYLWALLRVWQYLQVHAPEIAWPVVVLAVIFGTSWRRS